MSQKQIKAETKKLSISKGEINEYKEAFDIFDKNNTGIISTDDIIKIKKIFSYPISGDDIEKMIKEIDTSGNGKFDFQKFVIFMKKQIEYLDEKDGNIVLESIKDEYLGNKRKREKLSQDNSKNDCDLELLSNVNSFIEEKDENKEEMLINNEDINNDISSNNVSKDKNKKKKLENNIIRIKINDDGTLENINTKITIDLTSEKENDDNDINTQIKKSNSKGINESGNNSQSDLMSDNNILIYKENLPKYLLDKIEQKNKNNSSIIKIQNNNNDHIPIKDNSLSMQKPISSFSSKFIPDFDFINMSNASSVENSFTSELSLDYLYRPPLFSLYRINTRFDRTPMINVKRRKKEYINYSSKKLLDGIKEKLINKGVDFNNKNINKNSLNKSKIKDNLQKIVNNDFYGSESINIDDIHSKLSFDDIKEFFNKDKSLYENNSNFIENNIKIKEETVNNNIKTEDIPQIQGKKNKENIQILNTFEFEYVQNNKKEKIIKKVKEIPYLTFIFKKRHIY